MYSSYGSSASVGSGKRGHGGKDYHPPRRKKRDPNTTPPPMKHCSCLLQFQIEEYMKKPPSPVDEGQQQQPGSDDGQQQPPQKQQLPGRRTHHSFVGSHPNKMQKLEADIRSNFLCHLIVPGRKQAGPVAIVGRTIQEALPAAVFLLDHLIVWDIGNNTTNDDSNANTPTNTIKGQIQSNVKNLRETPIVGYWCEGGSSNDIFTPNAGVGPNWLFQSLHQWSIMVCPIRIDEDDKEREETKINVVEDRPTTTAEAVVQLSPPQLQPPSLSTLKGCIDNVMFRIGNTKVQQHFQQMFIHEYDPLPMAIAIGCNGHQGKLLLEEIQQQIQNELEVQQQKPKINAGNMK